MTIKLGDKVKDIITGFEGIAVCRTDWLHGCTRFGVQPEKLHEGKPIDSVYFDEPQLMLLKSAKVPEGSHVTGGPRPTPQRAADPKR